MARELEFYQQAERSIVKKYRRELWTPFITAVQRYELVREGDKIAVCVSGGKDSMLLSKLMQELHRHGHTPFEVVYLCMDPGYNAENRARIEENAEKLRVPLTIFESDVFEVANAQDHSACYLCAKMRRGHLYAKAQELGCNKIALGHHFNDVIETTVMGMFWSGMLQGMPPKLHSQNFPGMELSTRTTSSRGRGTTTCNFSNAPAASPRRAPRTSSSASARRSRRCCGN